MGDQILYVLHLSTSTHPRTHIHLPYSSTYLQLIHQPPHPHTRSRRRVKSGSDNGYELKRYKGGTKIEVRLERGGSTGGGLRQDITPSPPPSRLVNDPNLPSLCTFTPKLIRSFPVELFLPGHFLCFYDRLRQPTSHSLCNMSGVGGAGSLGGEGRRVVWG